MKFKVTWLDGTKEVIEGINEREAFRNAGYGQMFRAVEDKDRSGKLKIINWTDRISPAVPGNGGIK